jgi:hypothetical protein
MSGADSNQASNNLLAVDFPSIPRLATSVTAKGHVTKNTEQPASEVLRIRVIIIICRLYVIRLPFDCALPWRIRSTHRNEDCNVAQLSQLTKNEADLFAMRIPGFLLSGATAQCH